jgi:hypothetical protein
LTYPLKQDVPHSSDLVFFLIGMTFFYSVVAVARSAVPFTLKAAEFSLSALQHSEHCCNFQVNIFIAYFFQQNLEDLIHFFHVNCLSEWDSRELISIVE